MDDHERRATVAESAAAAGGAVALDAFRSGVAAETKADAFDVVTRADRDAQARTLEVIGETYPDDPVVAEEDGLDGPVPGSGPAWIVDPIDGTANYVRGMPIWGTAVAATVDGGAVAAATVLPALDDAFVAGDGRTRMNGEPVTVSDRTDPASFAVCPTMSYGPDERDEYAALCGELLDRFGDVRRYGSAQATLAMVASGQLEAAVATVGAWPWDSVAGVHLIERAGGTVTDLGGNPWRWDADSLVASNGTAHDEVLAAAQAARQTG